MYVYCVEMCIRVTLGLRNFGLHDFALTQLENLHDFSNLHDSFDIDDPWSELVAFTR
jgi:hypothetical protein